MSQPTSYVRQSDFSDWSANNPELPHDGVALDSEFNAIKTTLDQTLSNLVYIQRDDRGLANQTVGVAQLKAELLAAWGIGGIWDTGVEYAAGDLVFYDSGVYECLSSHTSGTFATDLAALRWEIVVDLGDNRFITTSTTALVIGTGSKTFTVDANKAFEAGMFVLASSQADTANYMHGTVTSYSGTTLAVNVTSIGGAGTKSDWTVSLSGAAGATGATGAPGLDGGNLVTVSSADTTSGYLYDKLTLGTELSKTIVNPGANENIQLSLSTKARAMVNIYAFDNFK